MVAERRSDAIVTSRLGAQQLDGAPSGEPALSLSKGSGGLRPIPASHILSLAQYEGWPAGRLTHRVLRKARGRSAACSDHRER